MADLTGADVEIWEGRPIGFWSDLWRLPRLEIHATVGSTNDRARALAEEGWGPYTTVVAEEQTAGRGRTGAEWVSAPGSGLWLSVLLPVPSATHLPLLVGLAATEAIERTCPGLRARIEWPNDVTISDRKVAGILCEGVRSLVVAGVGINTRAPPGGFAETLAKRATTLESAWGRIPDRAALAGALLTALRGRLAAATPLLSVEERQALSERDALAGRPVITTQHGRGRAVGIADDGALVLEREDGRRIQVRAGSVRPA